MSVVVILMQKAGLAAWFVRLSLMTICAQWLKIDVFIKNACYVNIASIEIARGGDPYRVPSSSSVNDALKDLLQNASTYDAQL